MDVDAEARAKTSRRRWRQRRTGGDERANGIESSVVSWQGRQVFEHHRNQRRDRAFVSIRQRDERMREIVVREDNWRSLQHERCDEIRETVRMREGDGAEVDVMRC